MNLTEYKCDVVVTDESTHASNLQQWWMEGVIQIGVACLGLAGNSLAIPVLLSGKLNSIFNKILVFLAVFDNVFIVCSLLEAVRKNFRAIHDMHVYLFAYFLYQVQSIAIVASIFTTVVLALERFLAVSKPIEYHNATQGMNPWRRVLNYVIPVMVFSTFFSIPKFFETKVVVFHRLYSNASDYTFINESMAEDLMQDGGYDDEGGGVDVRSVPEVMPADLRMNDAYVFYYNNLAKLVITGLVPFVSLCFFNFKIYSSLRRRRSVMGPAACAAHQQQLNEDNRQALVLFGIVIIFIVTNTPRILINVDEVFNIEKYKEDMQHGCGLPPWILIMGHVSQLLMMTNSSINFFIYCFMSSLFREVLCSTVKKYTEQVCGSSLFMTEGQRRRRRRKRSQNSGANASAAGVNNGATELVDTTHIATATNSGSGGQTETLPLRQMTEEAAGNGDVNRPGGGTWVNGTSV